MSCEESMDPTWGETGAEDRRDQRVKRLRGKREQQLGRRPEGHGGTALPQSAGSSFQVVRQR